MVSVMLKRGLTLLLLCTTTQLIAEPSHNEKLKQLYSKSPKFWPTVETADGVPATPLAPLKHTSAPAPRGLQMLGAKLFHDPILSRDKSVSCASCHEASKVFSDGIRAGIGIEQQEGNRNTPAIIGIDHWRSFFWDGRAENALEQALMPIENPIEMDLSIADALERLNSDEAYRKIFRKVFQRENIEAGDLAAAIVAFERTIDVPDTKYQRFIQMAYQAPEQAVEMLSEQELNGLHLFRTKAKCMTCHEGPLLSDNEFHITGFHNYGRRFEDLGRYEHTKVDADSGKFRTPTLLAVTQTSPWMHNGLFTQFAPMIQQYNKGGFRPRRHKRFENDPKFPETTPLIVELGMNKQEMADLVAFLHTL